MIFNRKKRIKVGDIYEDCSHHPVLCLEVLDGDISGVSLIDGSQPRGCSIRHCDPRKMSIDDVTVTLSCRRLLLEAEARFRQTMDPTEYIPFDQARAEIYKEMTAQLVANPRRIF